MQHTISISLDQNGTPMSAYSVLLASSNPSELPYGVWDITSSEEIAPYGTSVIENPIGTYQYTFTVENGHVYMVSWEIIANAGENPSYKTYQVGPFFSINNDNIRAASSFSGRFSQGSFATVKLKITDFDGNSRDAENIYIDIYDPNGILVTLENNIPEHVDTGFYVFDWIIPDDQTEGSHQIVWNYIVDDIQKAEIQEINISEKSDSTITLLYSGKILELRLALENILTCAQHIPVYYEQARPSRDYKKFIFSFKNWNQSPGVRIYRNSNIVDDGLEINYFNGTIEFDSAILSQEQINADYNFRWFTDEELNSFLFNALQTVNLYPPHSTFTLDSVPDKYVPTVIYGAAKDAIRQLLMCLQFQQPQQVFGGKDGAQQAFTNLETLKKNYESDWEKLLEQKKYGPYPQTRVIVTPEYTLPGGRSRWFRYLFKS